MQGRFAFAGAHPVALGIRWFISVFGILGGGEVGGGRGDAGGGDGGVGCCEFFEDEGALGGVVCCGGGSKRVRGVM